MSLNVAVTMRTTRPTTTRPSGNQSTSARGRQGSDAVEATVKWFNADKGFGFVIVAGSRIESAPVLCGVLITIEAL